MKQTEIQKIAKVMEQEKRKLFCYACCYLGDVEEAKDVLQDIFLNLCKSPEVIVNIRDLKCYIFRCLFNHCNTLVQRKNRLRILNIDSKEVAEIEDPKSNKRLSTQTVFYQILVAEQEYIFINGLLNTIPQEQSEVIRLHIHGEKTFREISEIIGVPEASVKSRYRYGIEKLRKMIRINY